VLGVICSAPGLHAWAQEEAPVEAEEVAEEAAEDIAEEEGVESESEAEEPVAEEPAEPAPAVRKPVRPQPPRPQPKASPVRRGQNGSMNGNGNSYRNGNGNGHSLPTNNGGRPSDGQSQTSEFFLNFDNVELSTVVKSIAQMTGMNFVLDGNLSGNTVTIVSHSTVPPEMAVQILETILASHGYALISTLDGYLVKIAQPADYPEKIPTHIGTGPPVGGFDGLSTHIVGVTHADASELTTILKTLGSRNAQVDVYATTNTLIITDNADGVRRMFRFLDQVDVPGYATVVEFFLLEYTRAETLKGQLEEVLSPEGGQAQGGARPAQPRPASRRTTASTRTTAPGARDPVTAGSREEVLRIMADERLNALYVNASEGMMSRVREMIARLDTSLPLTGNNMRVYQLLHADPESMVEVLTEIVSGVSPRTTEEGGGGGQNSEMQPFEKDILITDHAPTKSLIIIATPQDYSQLEAVIAALDVPLRQVNVEAIVMDVTLSDAFSLESQVTSLGGNDVVGLSNTLTLAEILANPLGQLGALGGPGGSAALLDGVLETVLPDGSVITVPKVPLLIKALETITETDILSSPSVTVVDDGETEAKITVGLDVPVPTSSSSSLDQSTIGRNVFSQVRREEVGVKLGVTPSIGEGDFVTLDLSVEVSDISDEQVGTVDVLGPTFIKSLVENIVVIKDGSTGIIGGLIQEDVGRRSTQTPWLGDLPVVGWLFRSKQSGRNKRNLVVLVTPRIVRGSTDRITQEGLAEFQNANVDLLFDENVIRKVRRKHKSRHKYWPSQEAISEMVDETS
jgi:general secretion pathway protein D